MNPTHLPPDWREAYEERAAIREYDGGQTRADAEREALAEVIRLMAADATKKRPRKP